MGRAEVDRVPAVVRALWGQTEHGRRGPRPAMSVRSIATEAMALADADGLTAVSMAAVAQRLGFTTMSLYRYVSSKEELALAMVEVALGEPPDLGAGGWRPATEAWARAELAVLSRHPWVLDVRPGTPPLGPGTLGWMDAGLAALGRARLTPHEQASALLLVDGYVRNQVLLGRQFGNGEGARHWAEDLRSVIDRGPLPALAAALDAGAFDDDTATPGPGDRFPGDEFEFGLRLVLDGIERLQEGYS